MLSISDQILKVPVSNVHPLLSSIAGAGAEDAAREGRGGERGWGEAGRGGYRAALARAGPRETVVQISAIYLTFS